MCFSFWKANLASIVPSGQAVTLFQRTDWAVSACWRTSIKNWSWPAKRHEGAWRERSYSSYSFSTSTLDGGEWSASLPGTALSLGKGPPVPIVQEAGRAPELVWTQRVQEKFFRFCRKSNFDRPVVQPVVRHYTAWATRLRKEVNYNYNTLNELHGTDSLRGQ
jgi:hypothetical protein